MSRIKGKNTKPEMILRSGLFRQGFRFRVHQKDLPGKPDIILPKYKTVIFVHGCFWHYHMECKEGKIPLTNSKFWEEKFEKNVTKDQIHQEALRIAGWNVLVIWECEIENKLEPTLKNLTEKIKESKS